MEGLSEAIDHMSHTNTTASTSQECNAGEEQCEAFVEEQAGAAVQQPNKHFLLHVSSIGGRNHNPYPQGSREFRLTE